MNMNASLVHCILANERRVREAQQQAAEAAETDRIRKLNEAKAAEQAKLTQVQETSRIAGLLARADSEVLGQTEGIANITAIFNESQAIIDQFSATNPLQSAIAADIIEAVTFLLDNRLRYEAWEDLVDEGSEMYGLFLNANPATRPTI